MWVWQLWIWNWGSMVMFVYQKWRIKPKIRSSKVQNTLNINYSSPKYFSLKLHWLSPFQKSHTANTKILTLQIQNVRGFVVKRTTIEEGSIFHLVFFALMACLTALRRQERSKDQERLETRFGCSFSLTGSSPTCSSVFTLLALAARTVTCLNCRIWQAGPFGVWHTPMFAGGRYKL